jgi:hypothetical protein
VPIRRWLFGGQQFLELFGNIADGVLFGALEEKFRNSRLELLDCFAGELKKLII